MLFYPEDHLCDASLSINSDISLIVHRKGGALPDGTSVVGDKLIFGRPLRGNDSGVYECVVKNKVGVGKTDYTLSVKGKCKEFQPC